MAITKNEIEREVNKSMEEIEGLTSVYKKYDYNRMSNNLNYVNILIPNDTLPNFISQAMDRIEDLIDKKLIDTIKSNIKHENVINISEEEIGLIGSIQASLDRLEGYDKDNGNHIGFIILPKCINPMLVEAISNSFKETVNVIQSSNLRDEIIIGYYYNLGKEDLFYSTLCKKIETYNGYELTVKFNSSDFKAKDKNFTLLKYKNY